jgi:PAS domain S-box-containing protein
MTIVSEMGQHFVGPVSALALGSAHGSRRANAIRLRPGDVLRLDLRQADGAVVRVLGTVRSIKDADPDPGQSAVLEYVHPDSELELADWVRAWEASALEQVDALVVLFDRGGTVSWVNAAVERTTGWATSELLGLSFTQLQARLGFEIDLLRVTRCLLRTGSWSACVQLQTHDGQPRLVHVRVTAVRGPAGAIEGVTAIIRDETELHRLRAVAEAVNLAANVGQMFAGIRHELGNPINSLKTALTVLHANWRQFEVDRIEHYFERMLVEVGRVEYLLRSLRTFSAFEHVQMCPCSIRAMLADLALVVRTAATERGIRVDIDLSCTLWVKADPRALYQALLNLLTNAMDAAAETHGWVALRALRVGSGTVAIEVADNGEGIAAEDLEAVLRPFYTTKPHGTGLGLAIVQRLAMAMAGELVIDSTLGRGTRARVLLLEVPAGA